MRRRHLNNTTFCVSQACHTKEGEQYENSYFIFETEGQQADAKNIEIKKEHAPTSSFLMHNGLRCVPH